MDIDYHKKNEHKEMFDLDQLKNNNSSDKLENVFYQETKEKIYKKMRRNFSQKRNKIKILTYFVSGVFGLIIGGFLLTALLFAWYAKDLPQPGKLTSREIPLSTRIFDRKGIVLYDVFEEKNRTWVDLNKIPKYLQLATIAIEDKDFYTHKGFDLRGILRSVKQILIFHNLQGGSTLTQQLIKNALLSQERTLPRKIKEFILAVQVERKYSKDQILELYLNESPYGGTAWGVEAAAESYFDKKVWQLNLTESVIIAGLPQSPTKYSPYGGNPNAFKWRAQQVLRRMREDKHITLAQEKKVLFEIEKIKFSGQKQGIKAPHFVMFIKNQLIEQYGEKVVEQGGLQVTTTLDYKLQEKAQKIVKEEVGKMEKYKVGNGAAIVIDPRNGEILTMVGSKDYFAPDYDGNVNVVLSLRQPGSAIKPITYATALQKGYTNSSVLLDVKTQFGKADIGYKDYIPENYDGKYRGPVQLRFALANSMNIPAVKMLALTGLSEMLKNAYNMGLVQFEPTAQNLKRYGLAITLGGGETRLFDLATAFGVFANSGIKKETVGILKITDSKGKIIFENKPKSGKKVLTEEVAFLISHILLDDEARSLVFGRGSFLVIPGKTVSVKTGTTDDKRDNWTVGYTPSRVCGVWVGNNDNSKMSPYVESGATGASPIWNKIMREALSNIPSEQPKKTDKIIAVEVDAFLGGLPKDGYPKRTEYFIKGTEPTSFSPYYKKLKISKANGKLANLTEIAIGEIEEKDYIVFDEKDPVSSDNVNRWQESWEKYINDTEPYKSDSKYHPPKETSDAKIEEVAVNIKTPSDRSQINDHDVEIEAKGTSAKGIQKMIVEIDGSEKKTFETNYFKEKFNLSDGTHTIKVKAKDKDGREGSGEIKIGVNVPWDYKAVAPTSTPAPTPTPTIAISPTPTP